MSATSSALTPWKWRWNPLRAGHMGPAGHMAVFCNAAPGCRSVWYRPRHERRLARWPVLDAVGQDCATGDSQEDPGHAGDSQPRGVAVDAAAIRLRLH
jgi:hypothetical protein